jgi:Viral BACON domain
VLQRSKLDGDRSCAAGAKGPARRVMMPQYTLFAALAVLAVGVAQAGPGVQLLVSNESAPPGGTAQFKISLASPATIASGQIVINFDPTVFGSIVGATAFSASGDQWGMATVQGLQVTAQFTSASGGFGRLAALPILTVAVAILPGVAGGQYAVTLDLAMSSFKDLTGAPLTFSITPGSLEVGSGLSIQSVTPAGGFQTAGTVLKLSGDGFDSGSKVVIEGVSLSAVKFIGPQEIDVTLDGAEDLDGKDIRVMNGDDSEADFVCSLTVGDVKSGSGAAVYPILPWETYQGGLLRIDNPTTAVFVTQNQNPTPVQVSFTEIQPFPMGQTVQTGDVTIPPGGFYVSPQFAAEESASREVQIVSSEPVRMLELAALPIGPGAPSSTLTPFLMTPQDPASPLFASGDMAFSWQIGSAVPAAQQLTVGVNAASNAFTASSSTTTGGAWLQVTPTQGAAPAALSVSVSPVGLAPGSYLGTITLTPTGAYVAPTTVAVSLQVSTEPLLSFATPGINTQCCYLQTNPDQLLLTAPYGQTSSATLQVVSNGNPTAFSAAALALNGNRDEKTTWLTVTPSQGSTPATLTVTLNAEVFGNHLGRMIVRGPNNSIVLPVSAQIVGGPAGTPVLAPNPAFVTFGYHVGDPTPAAQQVMWSSANLAKAPVSASATTESGGAWLSPFIIQGEDTYAWINVNPAGLAPGTYTGLVMFTAAGASPGLLPVTLIIWSAAPPLAVAPTSLQFTVLSDGPSANQTLTLTSGETPLPVTVTTSTFDGAPWLGAGFATTATPPVTPADINVSAGTSGMLPGTYQGTVTLTAASGSVTVPVTLLVVDGPDTSPVIGSIVGGVGEAPSRIHAGAYPGEILTIYGIGLGEQGTTTERSSNGTFPTEVSHTRVLFDGVPAPILYASVSEVQVIAPPQIANQKVTNIQVDYKGTLSPVWGVRVLSLTRRPR